MKRIKIKSYKIINVFFVGILGLLGITSCGGLMAYGCPSADYKFNGNITSAETGEPISNIKVRIEADIYEDDSTYYYYTNDSTFSNINGSYEITCQTDMANTQMSARFIFTDIDSTENGYYQNLDTIVTFDEITFSGGSGSWYQGVATLNLDVKLKPKN